jgi:hypothetical protein
MDIHEECQGCGRTLNANLLENGMCGECIKPEKEQKNCEHNSRKYAFTESFICLDCGYCSRCKRKEGKYRIEDNPIPQEALSQTKDIKELEQIQDTVLKLLKEVSDLRRSIQENKSKDR